MVIKKRIVKSVICYVAIIISIALVNYSDEIKISKTGLLNNRQ